MAKYLYNGYELPKLPEWNRQAYPYAVILKFRDTDYGDTTLADNFVLYALDKMGYSGSGTWYTNGAYLDAYSGIILAPTYDVFLDGSRFLYDSWNAYQPSENWDVSGTGEENHYIGLSDKEKVASGAVFEIIWSNYDILDESGNVYLAASEPVSSEPVAPSDPLKDWLIGLALELARETRPISLKDVFDDEWPIQWKHPDIETNATKSGQSVKISNIIIPESDYANLVLDIKKNGVTTTYRYSETTQSYATVDYIKLYNSEQDADLTLFNVKKLGSVFPKTGMYVGRHDPCECTLTKGGA